MPSPLSILCRRLLLIIPSLVACGNGNEPTQVACSGPVTLTATAGTVPRFNWTPACRLFFLIVENPATGDDHWAILSANSDAIAPPVTYGNLPAGVTDELSGPVPLQAGTTYHAAVARFTGPGHDDGVLIGQLDFTP